MSDGEITVDIEQFIRDNIQSVEHLEILLLLAAESQREWNALEVSQKLCRQKESVAAWLEDLRDRGILSVRQEKHLLYSYAPDTRLRTLIQGLDRAYQVRKHSVIRLIFDKPSNTLRTFSDAFRIRRDN